MMKANALKLVQMKSGNQKMTKAKMVKYAKNLYLVNTQPFAGVRSCGSCRARKRTVEARVEGQMSAPGYTSHLRARPASPNLRILSAESQGKG